ncbi:PIR Superfamily Protein [Plasmodium ovale curtisi]|uniref:PIR Superfamily Protein n=1 Tax=Plasmodium ovale curtisi TaxID=864141 RepID=A0A1A8WFF6_PLAOA|nr:PIR Superfamily Protein [Plasmodium ovale curtisi]
MTLYATLEDLPSYKFYKKFDESDNNTYYNTCKSQERINSNEQFVQLCSRILKNLKLLAETPNEDTFHNKRCNDLNYWISEQLNKYHGVKDEQLNNSDTYIYLYTALISINKIKPINNKCKMDFNDVTTKEKRRRKNLHDYYENYKKLEQIITQKGKKCSREHHEYLNKCVSLYKQTQNFVHPVKLIDTQISAKEDVGRPPLSGVPVSGDRSDTDASSETSPSLSKTLMTTSIPWTPAGSIIRNRLLNRGGEMSQLHNNVADELWEDNMEPSNINSDRNEYQLSYQSL